MTREEKAKEKAVNYLSKTFKISASIEYLLSTNPGKAFTEGYAEGYADGLEAEKVQSDEVNLDNYCDNICEEICYRYSFPTGGSLPNFECPYRQKLRMKKSYEE